MTTEDQEALRRLTVWPVGVETQGTFGFLRSIVFDQSQVQHFSEPLDKTGLVRFQEGDTVNPAGAFVAAQCGR